MMVSLRNISSAWRKATPLAGCILALIGAFLLVIHLAGVVLDYTNRSALRQEGPVQDYISHMQRGAPFDLSEATRRIYHGTTHSVQRRIAFHENWLQWTLGRLYPPLARTQNTDRLLLGGLTDCSERCQILKTLAERAGHDCRFAGLGGHVVLEVKAPSGWQVADPDYGVAYPVGIAAFQDDASTPLIVHSLSAAGYPPPTIERYHAIVQSADDNVVLPPGSPLSPRLHRVEQACSWLAIVIPLGSLLAGIAMLRATPARRRSPAEPRRATLIFDRSFWPAD